MASDKVNYDHVSAYREAFNERKKTVELSTEGRRQLEWALGRAERSERAAKERLINATHDVQRYTEELAEVERDLAELRADLGIET